MAARAGEHGRGVAANFIVRKPKKHKISLNCRDSPPCIIDEKVDI